jgi:hypothetical protein
MIKLRRVGLAGNAARIVSKGMHMGYWWESHKKGDHLEDQDVDVGGWTILRWILEK